MQSVGTEAEGEVRGTSWSQDSEGGQHCPARLMLLLVTDAKARIIFQSPLWMGG